ncbi:hypothetical protein IAT38_000287 [Cryptococcus sp. DSM 104549]
MADINGTASSTPLKKEKKERHKARDRQAAIPAGAPPRSTPKGKERAVDGLMGPPSTTPQGSKKKRTKAARADGIKGASSSKAQLGEASTPRVPPRRTVEGEETWEPIPIAQNEVSRIPPIWSKDGRFYFSIAHTSIHIHSSTAPDFPLVSTLSSTHPKGHTKPITSVHLSPANAFQILTSSLDGTIKIWDWVAGRLVRSIEFRDQEAQVDHVTFGEVAGKWYIFAAVTNVKQGSNSHKLVHRVLRVPLSSSNTNPVLVGKLGAPPAALMMSPRSTYLVALAANKAYTYRMPTSSKSSDPWEQRPTCVRFVSDQTFTCGAFSPEKTLATSSEEEWFATGDQKGVIKLWHGLTQAFRQVDAAAQAALGGSGDASQGAVPETEKRLPTTSLHWHAHAVSAIAFTPSGSHLLSGGEESVLVQWTVATGKREYIPRLGGRPIVSLAVRRGDGGAEEEWWMALADGAVIRIGAASGHIANVGQGIRLDPLRPTSASAPYPIAFHPATSSLVVPSSHPSTLQFIDPVASTVLFDLEVAPSNRVSRRDEKELEPVAVEKVAFSDAQDGRSVWMATMEGRKGDSMQGGGMVKNLKVWKWANEKYMVNTQFPRPHSISDVTSVTFSPIPAPTSTSSKAALAPNPYLLTTSANGVAKLWHVRQAKKSEQGKVSAKRPALIELYWSCRSTFDYRNLPITASAFSPDITILALAHGSVITLWDVESNILLKVLDGGAGVDLKKVAFVGGEGRWLVGSGEKEGIVVWDLLSCEVAWAISAHPVESLIASSSSFFVTSSSDAHYTTLNTFSPASATPTRTISLPTPTSHLTLLPTAAPSHTSLHFIGVSPKGEISRFGDVSTGARTLASNTISTAKVSQGLSIWQEMFGKGAFLEEPDVDAEQATATASALQQRVVSKGGRPADVFDGPSHTMPPTGMLFEAFIDELLSGHTAQVSRGADSLVESAEAGAPQGDILYENGGMDVDADVPVAGQSKGKGRAVDDQEVAELEVFFRDVLSAAPRTTPATPAMRKPNGLPNGLTHSAKPSPASLSTPVPKKANGHPPASFSGLGSASRGVGEDTEGEGTPVSTTGSGKKKGGKKRKAPRDSEV